MNPTEFLRELWTDQPPGLICLWRLDGRRSAYLRSPLGAGGLSGATDIYCGVATTREDRGRHRRMKAHEAAAIAGLWLDVDVNGGPDDKTGAAPSLDTAIALCDTLRPPTIIVGSGYGIHAWWLFERPWVFRTAEHRDRAALASVQWWELHRRQAAKHGWKLDNCNDLARVLRLPGTINGKGGLAAPVEVLRDARSTRYSVRVLLDQAAGAGPIALDAQPTAGTVLVDVAARADAAPPRAPFEALLLNNDDFADTWRHERPDLRDQSLSAYDLALCSYAAAAKWTDQQLADLIAYHRRAQGDQSGKAGRVDYVRRTIAIAREGQVQRAALDDTAALVARLRGAAA